MVDGHVRLHDGLLEPDASVSCLGGQHVPIPRLVTIAADKFDASPHVLAGLYTDGVPLLRPYLGTGPHDRLICKNAGGPDAPYTSQWLQVWIRDGFLDDGSPVNQYVELLVTSPRLC